MEQKPFEVLGLPPSANQQEILDAFKNKLMEVHPEKGGTPADWRELMEAKNQALATIKTN